MQRFLFSLALATGAIALPTGAAAAAEAVPVQDYVRHDSIGMMRISPDGTHLATTVRVEDRTALAILRRSDGVRTASIDPGQHVHVADLHWVNAGRLVYTTVPRTGITEGAAIGRLHAVNTDGSGASVLNADRGSKIVAIRSRALEPGRSQILGNVAGEDDAIVVGVFPEGGQTFSRVERIRTAKREVQEVAQVVARHASFVIDHQGVARFAEGRDHENVSKLFYADTAGAEWKLVNDEASSGRVEKALGFSADGSVAYLQVEQSRGPDAVVAQVLATGERSTLVQDAKVDPWRILRQPGGMREPIGLMLMDGKPRSVFFDEGSDGARLYRSMEAAFPGQSVLITSSSDDGNLLVVETFSAGNPGDFFVYDRQAKKAQHIIARRGWIDPKQSADVQAHWLTARDGTPLQAYVTRPRGVAGGPLPMVVLPHGGPFDQFDTWTFNPRVQMLARAGYAVLQVNFRGSGNQGREFHRAGARQWGLLMQDDVTDATRWAIAEGIADPGSICIYGVGYGAYSAMMGAAREPQLYRCAAGDQGEYNLVLKYTREADVYPFAAAQARDWLGERAAVGRQSATAAAASIKAAVLLSAYADDVRSEWASSGRRITVSNTGNADDAYIASQTRGMLEAITRTGGKVESRIDDRVQATYVDYANQHATLLDFLSRHLGGAKAAAQDPK